MSERAGFECVVKISGAPVVMTGEATTATGNISYQITNTVKQVLDRDTPPTVLDGGVATGESYSVNYLTGTVTFGSASARTITITGKYLPMTVAASATRMSRADEVVALDITKFNNTHRQKLQGLKSASGTLAHLNMADTTFADAILAGDPVVIEDRTKSTDEPNRTWALLSSEETAAAVDGVQNQTVSWVSYDDWLRLGG